MPRFSISEPDLLSNNLPKTKSNAVSRVLEEGENGSIERGEGGGKRGERGRGRGQRHSTLQGVLVVSLRVCIGPETLYIKLPTYYHMHSNFCKVESSRFSQTSCHPRMFLFMKI